MQPLTCKNFQALMAVAILLWFTDPGVYSFSQEEFRVTISPEVVQPTNTCTLTCTYDNSRRVSALMWFRGDEEFFRATGSPGMHTSIKVFPRPGINVNVTQSNSMQIVLHDVSFETSGTYTCDVKYYGGFPTIASRTLTVVQLPEQGPALLAEMKIGGFGVGDLLSGACLAFPSRPAPTLRILLNNKTVASNSDYKVGEDSYLRLNMRLNEQHVCHKKLVLRCEVTIGDIYKKSEQMALPFIAKTDCIDRQEDTQLGVTLTLKPTLVNVGDDCTLTCSIHNIEDESLYTLKWYHGKEEFCRYTSTVGLSTFYTDVGLKVDAARSNSTQIVLSRLNFKLSGTFSCEVIANDGSSIASDTKAMTIVERIGDSPVMNITVGYVGLNKKVTASCKSPRSSPPLGLQFIWNNSMIGDFHVTTEESPYYSRAELVLNDVLPAKIMYGDLGILRCKTHTADEEDSKYVDAKLDI